MEDAIEVVLKKIEEAEAANVYPTYPSKPIKDPNESNAAFGARLDEYADVLKPKYRTELEAYRQRAGVISEEFRSGLLKALGIADHPKAKLLMQIAWEYGHSNGYREVAIYAEELAELLR